MAALMHLAARTLDVHLEAATGYLELGMEAEAEEELRLLSADDARDPRVLDLRVQIHRVLRHWENMLILAATLCDRHPDDPQWPRALAFATRQLHGPSRATPILRQAAERFPTEPSVYYDLACCEAASGHQHLARWWLREAILLGPALRAQARIDPDLAAL